MAQPDACVIDSLPESRDARSPEMRCGGSIFRQSRCCGRADAAEGRTASRDGAAVAVPPHAVLVDRDTAHRDRLVFNGQGTPEPMNMFVLALMLGITLVSVGLFTYALVQGNVLMLTALIAIIMVGFYPWHHRK
jgi:hypothetical protein